MIISILLIYIPLIIELVNYSRNGMWQTFSGLCELLYEQKMSRIWSWVLFYFLIIFSCSHDTWHTTELTWLWIWFCSCKRSFLLQCFAALISFFYEPFCNNLIHCFIMCVCFFILSYCCSVCIHWRGSQHYSKFNSRSAHGRHRICKKNKTKTKQRSTSQM